MKKKLIALLAAVAMVFSLAACGSTPDSVGTIGTVDITSAITRSPPACICWPSTTLTRRLPIWLPRSRMPPM